MKILFLSQYFWPETFIVNDLVRKLSEQGHEVTVATAKPNYPGGEIFDGYKAWGVQRERFAESVDVIRVPLWPRGRGGSRNLILNYLSFVATGLFLLPWLLRGRKFDSIVVFAMSPITQVIPAIPLKWIKRAHLAAWVQDLWPESLAATGFVRNPQALRMVGWMVRGIYACCDTLLLQSRAFFDPVARYACRSKLVYYPNSIALPSEKTVAPEVPTQLLEELRENFCVVFAGNIGIAQSIETVVEAAELLRQHPALKFVLVGSGSRLEWVKERKASLGLDNLILAGRFPMEAMPQIFEHSSALLVSLRDEEIFSYTIPSKVQAYLAAGKAIIASLRGEGARVIEEAGAGKTCEPESANALVESILALMSLSPAEREQMGSAGQSYFNEHFDMDRQTERLVEILASRADI
ncbi:Glycosyltransferase involved in cell wall bisynthesis [Ectopseudomonas chengduensis]|uniref:Glycosyltransferase involved in cell wall bisynthesis n=2 Tax=Ectopseudomonas chengduensis TaxID=489632 RepID=A0A1G6PE83_9GAMM|nr:glycosyltransferase family 4 protein [Pseudomonas chengduensis]MBP3060771.1 glycosyltransferase [Pseudomonas chengduensis]NNB73638.1 glycosyltransferase family 4 protein [Pseudomonas chengduensis]SDC78328.1 Glycosyltransferase involved in cell wall bisynthesis [Pseudomonas chengduensis]